MNKIEQIKAELKRLKNDWASLDDELTDTMVAEYDYLLDFLSTLESEKPINPEDAMKELDEKIALVKQRGTWDGVDVDKYMDEVRGRESEKPMQNGLEEEISRTYHDGSVADTSDMDHVTYENIARHFAKWGAEHTKIDVTDYCKPIDPGIAQCIADHSWEMLGEDEKSVPKDLEEYASRAGFDYVDNIVQEHPGHRFNDHDVEYAYRDGNIAGAKWQKEQMMKEAVEADVNIYRDLAAGKSWAEFVVEMPTNNLGEKVRIIIVKED